MDIKVIISIVSGILDVKEYMSQGKDVIQSFKNALQEWCADKKHRMPAPVYKTVSETGPDHKKIYERAVFIGDRLYAKGSGKNQKLADAAAAEATLKILMSEQEEKQSKAAPKSEEEDPILKLKAIAQKDKKPSPEFRDLGESVRSTERSREYEIECRFMGKVSVGAAEDKRTAKRRAASQILAAIYAQENKENKNQKDNRGRESIKPQEKPQRKSAPQKTGKPQIKKSTASKRPAPKRKFNKT